MRDRRWTILCAGLAVAVLLAGCGGGTAPAPAAAPPGGQAAAPKPSVHVSLRQPYLTSGYSVPFIVAKEKGYYRDAGFDVDILEGKGSATTIETVANGSDAFGFADAATAALIASKGAPVKVLSVYLRQSPMSFCFDATKAQINSPADLKGRTVISFAGDSQLKMLPAVLARYNMTMNDVKLLLTQPTNIVPTLAEHPGAVLLLFDTDFPRVTKVIPTAKYVPFSQFGINLYSIGLLTSQGMIRDHPDQVRAFVAASQKGWEYALQHPDEAVDLALKEFPQVDRNYLKGSWEIARSLLNTPNTEGRPIGWMSDKDWQQTLDLLQRYAGLENPKPLDFYYTNAFLPQS